MPSCSLCGSGLPAEDLCSFHSRGMGDDWGRENRIWCDFLHRGIEIPRLPPEQRDDPQQAYTE